MVTVVNPNNMSATNQSKTTTSLLDKEPGENKTTPDPLTTKQSEGDAVSISKAGLLLQPQSAGGTSFKMIENADEASMLAKQLGEMFTDNAPVAMQAHANRITPDIIRLL